MWVGERRAGWGPGEYWGGLVYVEDSEVESEPPNAEEFAALVTLNAEHEGYGMLA